MLQVADVRYAYRADRVVVDGVSFRVSAGETLALVGESGCGKSTLARLVMGLLKPVAGSIEFNGARLDQLSEGARRPLRRDMQMVFQDPAASLNPRRSIWQTVAEPLWLHEKLPHEKVREQVVDLLEKVGLNADHLPRFPHEFSGGQRQRISIARALATRPKLLVLDEPTSALDVSVQAQILNLLVDLQRDLGLAYLFITHDMSVVAHMSDRVGVMFGGKLVEIGDASQVLGEPRHEYTRTLLASAQGNAHRRQNS